MKTTRKYSNIPSKLSQCGKPQTDAQRLASRENWMLFQLYGMKSALAAIERDSKELPYGIANSVFNSNCSIDDTIAIIKLNQAKRKEK